MGKLHKEDDAAAASGGLTPSRSVGRKRDLGWKMIYIVTVMGFIGMLQLIVVESRWWSSWDKQSPHASVDFGRTTTTTFMRSSSTSSQHAVPLSNPSWLQSRSPPCKADCANSDNKHFVELQERRNEGIETKPIVQDRKNENSSRSPPCETDCANSDNQHSVELQKQRNDDIEIKPKNENLLKFSPSNSFLPMKDVTQSGMSDTDTNWFMSGLHGRTSASGETFDLPRDDPAGRLLCVRGADQHDGTKNSYGLFQTPPADALFLPGTTFIADNYWDYHNPWHAMSALANFATWRMENNCAAPDRLLLYHMGELVVSMGEWITHILNAAFMKPIPVETLTLILKGSGSVCFERAVVQRRGLGGVDEAHVHAVFDMLRCKARRYCGVRRRQDSKRAPAVLLLTRSGPRAFANESGVAAVVRNECEMVPGCDLRVLNAANLTFCEQVEVMSGTDVLISVHGAQLTNMMFMSPGSRLMELFPKGWQEFAGVGQEIYKWHADWTRVIHAGRWRDPHGPDCPFPTAETLKCLLFFKDREVGLNATHLALWTRSVLAEVSHAPAPLELARPCACGAKDRGSGFGADFATKSTLP